MTALVLIGEKAKAAAAIVRAGAVTAAAIRKAVTVERHATCSRYTRFSAAAICGQWLWRKIFRTD